MKTFPILLTTRREQPWQIVRNAGQCALVVALPWEMIAPHAAQAQKNHGQTLERLAERGGLSHGEAVAVLQDREWSLMPDAEANGILGRMMVEFATAQVR